MPRPHPVARPAKMMVQATRCFSCGPPAPARGLRDVVQGRPSQTTRGRSGPRCRTPSESSGPPELRDTEKLSSFGIPPNVAAVILGAAEAGGPPGCEEERGCSLSANYLLPKGRRALEMRKN